MRQFDADGEIVSERHVEAMGADAVLRKLQNIHEMTQRIDVIDGSGQRVGQIGGDYWRQKYRRGKG